MVGEGLGGIDEVGEVVVGFGLVLKLFVGVVLEGFGGYFFWGFEGYIVGDFVGGF